MFLFTLPRLLLLGFILIKTSTARKYCLCCCCNVTCKMLESLSNMDIIIFITIPTVYALSSLQQNLVNHICPVANFFNRIPHTEVGQLAFGSRTRLLHAHHGHHGQTQMTFYENLFPRSQADCCSGTLILCIFSVIYRLNYNITDTASSISIFVSVYKSHN